MEEMSVQETSHEEEAAATQSEDTKNADLFWNVLQSELNTDIPTYVKNIMRQCHLHRPLSFRCIRDETIEELEKFARKSMMYQLMGVQVNLQDYYGPFHKMPNKFKFAIGDRLLIKQLVACTKSKSDEFWRRALNPNRRAIATTTTTTNLPQFVSVSELHQQQQQQQQQHEGNSSELEMEDEEDKLLEEPLDLDRERRKLAELVRSSLLKEEYGDGVDAKQVAARVKVRVVLKTAEEMGTDRDVVTGYIKCVFCPTRLMIRKQSFGTRKPRWVISNYRRHIRFHTEGKLKRPVPEEFAGHVTTCKTDFYMVDVDNEQQADDQTINDVQQYEEHDVDETSQ